MDISAKMSATVETVVDTNNIASTAGSGTLPVFATPMMIAQMEKAAGECMAPGLEKGQSSVGIAVHVEHVAASPVGMKITTTATVTAVDGRKVEFDVVSHDGAEVVGRGTHTRFVVNAETFMEKAMAKQNGK